MTNKIYLRCFIILLLMCNLLLTSCEYYNRQGLEAGKQSFLEQNYREAFLRLKPIADAGDADAQYAIGYMYYYGQGVVEDKKAALSYIKLSAMQNHLKAQNALQLLFKSEASKGTGPMTLDGNKPL